MGGSTKKDFIKTRMKFWATETCCCCSVTQWCLTLCDPVNCKMPSFPVLHHLLEHAHTHIPWVSDAIQLSCPLLTLLLLPSIFPSIRVFSNELALCIRWPRYWSFSFNISPSNEYSGVISFRIDWFDLLAVQGSLKGLLQHHSLKASILWRSAFFMVQLSHPYKVKMKIIQLRLTVCNCIDYTVHGILQARILGWVAFPSPGDLPNPGIKPRSPALQAYSWPAEPHMTTGKIIALTMQTFDDKVMTLLFYMLSSFVIAFLPRRKHLLISWLQSPSTVILEPKKIKVRHCFHCFPICLPWSSAWKWPKTVN